MANYPEKRQLEKRSSTTAKGVSAIRSWVQRVSWSGVQAAAASNTAIRTAVLDNAALQEYWVTPTAAQSTETRPGLQPTAAPTLIAQAGTTALGAGIWLVSYCYRTVNGLTRMSPSAQVTLAATNQIAVSALPAPPAGVLEVLYFMTPAPVTTVTQPNGTIVITGGTAVNFAAANTAGAAITLTLVPSSNVIVQPSAARNITATSGGTVANITGQQVTIFGLDWGGSYITETLPVFTAATATTVVGAKAFKTVLGTSQPAIGVGVTVQYGSGSKLGLPDKLYHNTVDFAFLANVREVTAPTVTTDSVNLSGNTLTLASALNGSPVDVYYYASQL